MILVTGGTGLVGAHLLYKLISSGKDVRAIYRQEAKLEIVKKIFSYYTTDYINLFNRINWVKSSLDDIPKLTEAFKAIDIVYHCAAFVSFEPDKYHLLRQTNIEGTANIVNLSIANHVKKLCHVSSVATLGNPNSNKIVSEESHWNPDADNHVYGITKYGAEMEVWRGTQEGVKAIMVNPGVIIGAGIWRHGSGNIFKKIYDGVSYYPSGNIGVIDIEDVVNIMIALMDSQIYNERFLLISENWSYKSFLQTIAKELGITPPKKVAKQWQLQTAWRLDWLKRKLTGKRRMLTRHLVRSLNKKNIYNNDKIKSTLDYNFKPISESIHNVSKIFLKEY